MGTPVKAGLFPTSTSLFIPNERVISFSDHLYPEFLQ